MVILTSRDMGGTCRSPCLACSLYFKQVLGLRVCRKICTGLMGDMKLRNFTTNKSLILLTTRIQRNCAFSLALVFKVAPAWGLMHTLVVEIGKQLK